MDLFIHFQIANIYFIYLFIKEFIFYWDMKRIQAPNPNKKSFTVPIFTLSSVIIQKWHYIAMHPKPEHSYFMFQIRLYFMHIPLPCDCPYFGKNV